jgi:hypothetical protein
MDKAREQHNVLMDKGREQLTAFGVSCYMRKLRITANDTKSLATKYSQAHFIYGNTEWFTAYDK